MSIVTLQQIRKSIGNLNPHSVREASERQLDIALYAASAEDYHVIENYLLEGLSPARRRDSAASLHRGPDAHKVLQFDLAIYDESVLAPSRALLFERHHPERLVKHVLARHPDPGIPLARAFSPFREPFIESVIQKTCRENTLFSLATALPDVLPSFIEIPWAVTEFASDTAFLTMTQIKMAFSIAAASDRKVGYLEQKSEIASVIGGAFGFRAIARQLVGKIPFGGGLLPKAAIAYAGTKVVGKSLERLYRIGYGYTAAEREELYQAAFVQGKSVAQRLLGYLWPNIDKKGRQTASRQQDRQHEYTHTRS